MKMSNKDLQELKVAKDRLEHPGFAVKIADRFDFATGAIGYLPEKTKQKISRYTEKTLTGSMESAMWTMKPGSRTAYLKSHMAAVTATGSAGGFFGMSALALELPVSTGIMLRSIAAIGRAEGENIRSTEFPRACLSVFALPGEADGESRYLSIRQGLNRVIRTPGFITLVAQRFGVQLSERLAAQLVPIVGAVGGGVLNYGFMDHYQETALGHFKYRRLERKYDPNALKEVYMSL